MRRLGENWIVLKGNLMHSPTTQTNDPCADGATHRPQSPRSKFGGIGAALALLFLAAPGGAAPPPDPEEPAIVAEWRFDTPAALQPLAPRNWERLEVREGVLQGVTRYDAGLEIRPARVDAGRAKVIGFRVRSDASGNGELFFAREGEAFTDARKIGWEIAGDGEWHDVYVPAEHADWKGTLTALRFDPINPAARLSIAWLRLLTGTPHGRIPNGSFEEGLSGWRVSGKASVVPGGERGSRALKLAAGARAVSDPLDLSFLGTYRLRARVHGGAGALTLTFRDLEGRSVGRPVRLAASASSRWTPVATTFALPTEAAEGSLTLAAAPGAAVEWDAVGLDEVARFRVDVGPQAGAQWLGEWVWHPQGGPDQRVGFRRAFTLPAGAVERALMQVTADDTFTLYLNGRRIATDEAPDGWRTPELLDVAAAVRPGRNLLAVEARNAASAHGLLLDAEFGIGGKSITFCTDDSWKAAVAPAPGWERPDFDDTAWAACRMLGKPPAAPWGSLRRDGLGPLRPAAVVRLDVPATLMAGTPARCEAVFRTTATGPIVSELVSGDLRVPFAPAGGWPVRRDGDLLRVGPADVLVPPFVPGGAYRLRFGPAGTTLLGRSTGAAAGPQVTVLPRRPGELARAEVRAHRGSPTLFINGRPTAGVNYNHIRDVPFQVRNVAGAGVHLYVVDVKDIGWAGPGRYDYTRADAMILSVLLHDPAAYVIPTFDLSGKAFPFWRLLVPRAEWTVTAAGTTEVGDYHGGRNEFPSLASPTWARLSQEALRRFARHLYASPWADRVVGYWPCDGISWEWFPWGAQSQEFVDYSPAYRRAFQEWARLQYPGLDALNRAWHTAYAAYEEIPVPTKEERLATDRLAFRDPAGPLRRVTDFYRFHHEQVADRIDAYARVLKEESGRRHVVGTYYGYVAYLPEAAFFGAHSGHFALNRYLASPNLDFACSPTPYGNVRAVGAPSGYMTAPESFRRAGKLWINQADIRTHWTTQEYSPTRTLRDSAEVLRREFALTFVKGHLVQWYDFSNGWVSGDPRLCGVVKQLQRIAEANLDADRVSPPETLAVVVEETHLYAQRPDRPLMGGALTTEMRDALGLMGVPYDTLLASDLPKPDTRKYPAYLFLNCFRLTEEQRQVVEALKSGGRTLAFVYAPGILSDGDLRPERVSEVVGQGIVVEPAEGPLRVSFAGSEHPLAAGLAPHDYGAPAWYQSGPLPRVEDPRAEVVARYVAGGAAAVSVRRYPDWTSVYLAVPVASPAFLRNLARLAGLHVYLDTGDAVYASNDLLAVHTRAAGVKTLRLPRKATVVDLLTGQVVARDADHFTVRLPARATAMWRLR